jgi:hypothetical protein
MLAEDGRIISAPFILLFTILRNSKPKAFQILTNYPTSVKSFQRPSDFLKQNSQLLLNVNISRAQWQSSHKLASLAAGIFHHLLHQLFAVVTPVSLGYVTAAAS